MSCNFIRFSSSLYFDKVFYYLRIDLNFLKKGLPGMK